MDEMIGALTKGIGVELGKPIRRNYFQARSALQKQSSFQGLSKAKQQFAIDLLALTIFHTQAIVPLHGSARFLTQTRRMGVVRVQMSEYMLTKEHAQQADAITRQFFAILKAFGIEISDLHFESTSDLVQRVGSWSESRGEN